jgi:hypothetical protein
MSLRPRILPTDTLFQDSPDAGDQACVCSRCGEPIGEEEGPPVRVFVDQGKGGEYRYHCDEVEFM